VRAPSVPRLRQVLVPEPPHGRTGAPTGLDDLIHSRLPELSRQVGGYHRTSG
jgi:hypothetical protein